MLIHKDFNLQDHHSFGVSVKSEYFSSVGSLEELQRALQYASDKRTPVYVIGEGSNVLFTKDFPGLIIKVAFTGVEIDQSSGVVRVAAGENWHSLVTTCMNSGLHGLENLALIPGSVGAAPVQNIGAYGVELASFVKNVRGLDISSGEPFVLNASDCRFGYRDSIFKKPEGANLLVTEVTLQLQEDWLPDLSYSLLDKEFCETPVETPQELFSIVCRIRRRKLPDPKIIGNAGSFFKNPFVSASSLERLKVRHQDIVWFDTDNEDIKKISAAWLLEKLGWKGRKHGGAEVSSVHALVLINAADASGKELSVLAQHMVTSVLEEFGIVLEPEVSIL